ncbi:uncharacterized protein B0H18DRAFT_420494 [Fomitopsis serialis]|uniref:uncharacterized protein n=1 Tax=Fomitopsis serialis TaxID=139415 RepID=UPI00200875CB|nr:uncharacterized protein B0H18DRAFT_420494 [Neoantrodia serialis]KAH9935687.1 hypothetical protein B0H18DRAFT_420494 [Neoantrodia serialis]
MFPVYLRRKRTRFRIENIPLEIWERICSFACTDDGYTGLSLSKVSRYFRNASRLCRLQSVAIREATD